MKETWKKAKDKAGNKLDFYVSNFGNIKAESGKIGNFRNTQYLSFKYKKITYLIHKLVADTFIRKIKKEYVVKLKLN